MLTQKKLTLYFILFASLQSSAALPSNMQDAFTLSLGSAWESAGDTQTLFLTPTIEKTYLTNNNTHSLFVGDLFWGKQWLLTQAMHAQLGVSAAATHAASLSGEIWDDAYPQFNNYIYHYKVSHTHVALKGKLLSDQSWQGILPWISVSLGVGFNKAFDYSSQPVIFPAVATPNFHSHTETAFTYTFGAGLQHAFDSHWQMGLGYEFTDWGQNHLNPAMGQTIGDGLSMSHFYTNALMLNLTFLS